MQSWRLLWRDYRVKKRTESQVVLWRIVEILSLERLLRITRLRLILRITRRVRLNWWWSCQIVKMWVFPRVITCLIEPRSQRSSNPEKNKTAKFKDLLVILKNIVATFIKTSFPPKTISANMSLYLPKRIVASSLSKIMMMAVAMKAWCRTTWKMDMENWYIRMECTTKETSKMTAFMVKEHCFMAKIDQLTQVIGATTNSTERAPFTTSFLHQTMLHSTTAISTKSKNPGSNFKVPSSLS